MRLCRPLVPLAALVLAACQVGSGTPSAPRGEGETRLKRTAVALKGVVMAPAGLIGNDAGSLIGGDGGSLVGADGSSLVGNNGNTLVAAGAGNAVATGPAARRVLQAADAPLANASCFLAHADGTPVQPPVSAMTDARGRYAFPLAPAGRYVVVAMATSAANRPVRLLALATAVTEDTTVDVSLATTVVTSAALDRREGPIVGYDTGTYARAVALAGEALAGGKSPDLADRGAMTDAMGGLTRAKPDLAGLIAKLRAEVVGTPRPRATPPAPATAAPPPGSGAGSPLIGGAAEVPTPPPAVPEPGVPAPPTPAPTPLVIVPATSAAPELVPGAVVDTISGAAAGFADGVDAARFNAPAGITVSLVGTIFVGDTGNHAVRRLINDPINGHTAATPWGDGVAGYDTAAGRGARFRDPMGLCVEGGRRYIADAGNNVIRVAPLAGATEVFAGDPAQGAGFADGPAAAARFAVPTDVWWAAAGLYVADAANHRVRLVANGVVTTVAGGESGFVDGPAATARFDTPASVAVGSDGAVYVADTRNHRIRVIRAGQVTTLAGDGTPGFADGAGARASFYLPSGLALASDGTLFVADRGNRRVRAIAPNGHVRTLAGDGGPLAQDGGGGRAAFADPRDVAVSPLTDFVYVADGHRIRRIRF